jgi:hypothetical protein
MPGEFSLRTAVVVFSRESAVERRQRFRGRARTASVPWQFMNACEGLCDGLGD